MQNLSEDISFFLDASKINYLDTLIKDKKIKGIKRYKKVRFAA